MQNRQRTFVIGDIHGAAKALEQCLERAGADLEHDLFIQLGDVTDGYPDVYECVETLLQVKNLIALKGNHDDWFGQFIETGFHPQYWNHGGPGTLESYLDKAGKSGLWRTTRSGYKTALLPADIPPAHRRFFMRQGLYHIDEQNRCFVHGGFKPGIPLEIQKPQDFYWDRALWENAYRHQLLSQHDTEPVTLGPVREFTEVFLGHTPTINWGIDKPLKAFNIHNLDTGAGHAGRLTIMDVDSKAFWQSDPLLELYAKGYR